MEARENVVVSGPSEAGGGGDGAKDSPSSTPSPSPTPSPPACSGAVGTGAVVPPPPPPVMGMATSMSMGMGVGMGMGMGMGSGGSEDLARKKRGRPRKYGTDGSSMSLALSPTSSCSPFSPVGVDFSGKRGRGRPPGSGKRQLLAALGEWFAYSAGGNFTPHVVTVGTGEDVAARILSFSQKGPRAICILSANGAISNVTLRQPGSSGGTLTYEGRFEILSLSGSFTVTETGGVRSRSGGISVSLAGPDGRVVGGGVAGLLLAASPIQVVVGSFLPNTFKEHKRKAAPESAFSPIPASTGVLTAARPITQATPDDDCETPSATVPGQGRGDAENSMSNPPNPNSSSFRTADWHGLQSSGHKPSPDINICLPAE
ncbi:AT-hook motif nuclear-localized protein 7-like [Phoenix dactylifera]|uniref:AT-hook motif nuclear-localized protein n=1 Tax=Phoenix dactylifera TaxID=42345 RepID=A0A8B7BGU4_PHODC|nr:AT-hook motif nuclear-localized protein 7-like [Phoenix dactylifera]